MSVYEQITRTICAAIEQGAGEFVLPWHRGSSQNFRPTNAATRASYRGVNVIALWAAAQMRGYNSGEWATYKQWSSLGAQVQRGEKSSIIVFYREIDSPDDAEEDAGARFVARASDVFNAAQVEGYSPAVTPPITSEIDRHAAADAFIAATGAKISHGGTRAYYRPSTDEIVLPPSSAFVGTPTSTPAESYYATVLHELAHWSGAESRLARTFGTRFGDAAYAAEELVAELTAAFLTADLGVSNAPRQDHAQYLSSWLTLIRADTRAIFTAASAAARAADFLHALQPRQESAAA